MSPPSPCVNFSPGKRANPPSDQASFRGPAAGVARTRNTTKCEIEKFTTKLARTAKAFASHTGNNRTSAATRSVAVLATHPATPEETNVKYARQRSLRPDSAAKVIEEFMT